MKSQNERILAHLKSGKPITALYALTHFQCMRLASRINELKDRGFKIRSRLIELDNGKHVSSYSL